MKLPRPYTLSEISNLLQCDFVGDKDMIINGFNEIHRVEAGDIVFVDHPKYYERALNSQATVILINKAVEAPKGKGLLISDDPFRDFNKLIRFFNPATYCTKPVSEKAVIGKDTIIEPFVTIGDRVVIGKNCIIYSGVRLLNDTIIGDHVIIQPNTVVGSHAFYYKRRPEGYDQLLSGGGVTIEDYVEIGAGCTIDRGVTATTLIGQGTKIDNQVQIGHDTIIGRNCLIASQVGIAGCVDIGDEVIIWGQVGIASGLKIGSRAVLLGQSGVTKDLEGGKTYFGSPAEDARKKYRELASIRVLPEIIEKLEMD